MWLEVLGLLSGGILGAAILLTVDYFLTEDHWLKTLKRNILMRSNYSLKRRKRML